MDNANSFHLSEEQLASFQDGEASASEAAHLETCEECRQRLRDLESALAAYAEYRDSVRGPAVPSTPRAWARFDVLVGEELTAPPAKRVRWWPVAAGLAAAACLVLAVLSSYRTGDRASQHMSQLLTESARAVPVDGGYLALRVRGKTLLRPAVLVSDSEAGDAELQRLQELFAAAHYSWRQPLSAQSFQGWRSSLRKKQDTVSIIRQEGEKQWYRVRTDTPEGVLRSASLTLRPEDLRPTEGVFDFEGEGRLELSEAERQVAEATRTPAPVGAPVAREMPAGPEDTLHVLAALNEIGADVGEPIEISEDAGGSYVIVRANGLSTERQQQIAQVLTPLPRVRMNFAAGGSGEARARAERTERYSTNVAGSVRQELEDKLGGADGLQEVADKVLEASATLLATAHALQVLAEKFPLETEARLAEQDQRLLNSLRQRYSSEMGRLAGEIRLELRPLVRTSQALRSAASAGRGWQAHVSALVASARDTDGLLNGLLAGSYSQSSGEEMLRSVGPHLDRLEREIQAHQQGER